MLGLKQSPNFLSMRLVQVANNIKVCFEMYLQDLYLVSLRHFLKVLLSCILKILFKSIVHRYSCTTGV